MALSLDGKSRLFTPTIAIHREQETSESKFLRSAGPGARAAPCSTAGTARRAALRQLGDGELQSWESGRRRARRDQVAGGLGGIGWRRIP
jgi:hypothetical protein